MFYHNKNKFINIYIYTHIYIWYDVILYDMWFLPHLRGIPLVALSTASAVGAAESGLSLNLLAPPDRVQACSDGAVSVSYRHIVIEKAFGD